MKNDVDLWFERYENPQKPLMLKVRKLILSVDSRMAETMKWQAPTFIYNGNMASFNPRSKKHVSLMFHTGAKIPGKFSHLQISGDTAAYMTFTDEADLEKKKGDLVALTKAWVALKTG